MTFSEFITVDSKEWDVEMLENFVAREGIPLIQSLAISQSLQRDSYCWSFNKSGIYTVKSRYLGGKHIFKAEEIVVYTEPNITKLKVFAWKVKTPQKISHLIWQLLTRHVAVTNNLNRRHMRCDNICPKCGDPNELVTHAIFECQPSIQAWALAATPSHPNIFPVSNVYTNINYLLWRKK